MHLFKFFFQFILITSIYVLGQLISKAFNNIIAIPGSIIGMLLLLILLLSGVIKLNYVEDISNILLKNMSFFFIPLGVGLIDSFELIHENWYSIIIILIISNILVMGVTSKVTEAVLKRYDVR